MSSRVIKALLTASVLLAPGLSQAVSYKLSASSSTHYATLEQACLASGNAYNSSGTYTEIKYLSATEKSGGLSYTCNLQGLNKANVWKDFSGTVYKDEKGCAPGQSVAVKSAVAAVSEVDGKYVVGTRTPEEGCLAGCMVEQPYENGSDRSTGCYFVTGSTTQGFCNYNLKTTGQSCGSNTLSPGGTGDPLVKPEEPTDPGDDGTGTPTNPGCVFDCDDGGSGSGGTGGSGGSGGGDTGSGGGGTGGSGGNGSGDGGGTGSGGGSGTGTGGGSGSGGSGSGGSGGDGSGGSDTSGGTPCKGVNFGESGCAEYVATQGLNGTLETAAGNIKDAQDQVWQQLDDAQDEGNKIQEDAQADFLQRFNSMLPMPGVCVNPVLDFKITVITVDICRYTFVKQLMAWMFAALTMIYVYRVMTSLGTNSEV